MNIFIFISLTLVLSPSAFPKEVPHTIQNVQLINCYDGDTCTFREKGQKIKVRLFGVDAPEKNQEFGRESRDSLTNFIKASKTIDLKCTGKSYKRKVCEIIADGKSASEHQVLKGLAWDSPKYSKGRFSKLESEAKAKKIGLWSKDKQTRPECYRNPKRKGC